MTILTLTLNPSIDGSSEAETVRPIRKIRTSNESYDPGGGGINVARVAAALGADAIALYLAGGITGPVLDGLLENTKARTERIPIADHTRISHVVFERATGQEYRFVPEGPKIAEAEWRACLDAVATHDFDYLVASGSLARGVPEDFYVRVGAIAKKKGARLVLDTSGAPLRTTLEAGGIYLVKPSQSEFESLTGREVDDADAIGEAAMEFVRRGKAEIVAVTLGHHGAVLAHAGGVLRVPAIPVKPRSAVGAGDSFVAAMTVRLAAGADVREALLYGIAAGTAAVITPGTGLSSRDEVERLYAQICKRADGEDRSARAASA